ncbi:uncharacterized protein LOC144448877 [Glandiceps talaboti]
MTTSMRPYSFSVAVEYSTCCYDVHIQRQLSYNQEAEDETDDRRLRHQKSFNESFFAVKGAALILPQGGENVARPVTKHPVVGDLQTHLQAMFMLLRPQDTIKLAVRLESMHQNRIRYMVVVACIGREDTQESAILGIDYTDRATIGLVLPIWRDTKINLDGDGGFTVSSSEKTHIFKPVSVQALWSALQCLHKNADIARLYNYYTGGLNLTWTCYYEAKMDSDQACINEWNEMQDVESHRNATGPIIDNVAYATQKELTEKLIKVKLREIMMKVDIDNITPKQIRILLEEETEMNLKEFKSYIDEQMIIILRQMDAASEIFDHVYLGSEWNASNLEELKENGIGYILNMTREIDNFYPGLFEYKNVRVYDNVETDLLKYWDDTFKFMDKAREQGSKVFVHCKMGISRSSATVIAYAMKGFQWSLKKALQFVQEKRNCIQPNSAFMSQLEEYEGILGASQQRHNKLWRSKSETNLKESDRDRQGSDGDLPPFVPDGLLTTDDLREMMLSPRPKSWSPDDAMANQLLGSMDEISSDVVMPQDDWSDRHFTEPSEFVPSGELEDMESEQETGTVNTVKTFEMPTEEMQVDHVEANYASADEPLKSPIMIVVTPSDEGTEKLTFEDVLSNFQASEKSGENRNESVDESEILPDVETTEVKATTDIVVEADEAINTDLCGESSQETDRTGQVVTSMDLRSNADAATETVCERNLSSEKSETESVKELVQVELNDIGPSGQIVSEIAVIDKSSWTCVKRELKEPPPTEVPMEEGGCVDGEHEESDQEQDITDTGNGCEPTNDVEAISTYVKESIPWNPGTVQRQKLELEEKLKGKLQEHEKRHSGGSQESSRESSGSSSRSSPHCSLEDLRTVEIIEKEREPEENVAQEESVAMETTDADDVPEENKNHSVDDGCSQAVPEPGTVKRTMEIFHKIEMDTKEKRRSRSSSHGKSSHSSFSSSKSSRTNSFEDVPSTVKDESSKVDDEDSEGQDSDVLVDKVDEEVEEASQEVDSDEDKNNGRHFVIAGEEIDYEPGYVKKFKEDFEQKLGEPEGKEKITSPVEECKDFVKETSNVVQKDVIFKEAGENTRKETDDGKVMEIEEICYGNGKEKPGSGKQSPVEENIPDKIQVESHDITDMACRENTDTTELTSTDSTAIVRTYYKEETIDWPVGTVKQQREAIEGKTTKDVSKMEEPEELQHEWVKEGKLTVEELKTIRDLGKVMLGKPEEKTDEIDEDVTETDDSSPQLGMTHSCSDENLNPQALPPCNSVKEKARQLELTGTFTLPDMKKSASIAKMSDELVSPDVVSLPEFPDSEPENDPEGVQLTDDLQSGLCNQDGTVKGLVGIFNRHSACLESEKKEESVESPTQDIPGASQEKERDELQKECDNNDSTTSQGKQTDSQVDLQSDASLSTTTTTTTLISTSSSANVPSCVRSTGYIDTDHSEATTSSITQPRELIGAEDSLTSKSSRKVRMQHGKSHPLSKLNPKRTNNPFYNTM